MGLRKKQQPIEPEKPKPLAAIEAALGKTKKPKPAAPKKSLFNFGSSNASEEEVKTKNRDGGGGKGFFR